MPEPRSAPEPRTATGETDLARLLASLRPRLDAEEYAFCLVPPGAVDPFGDLALGRLREDEGTTAIAPLAAAEASGLPWSFRCRRLTLEVHSSLDAVGMLAAVLAPLARLGIAVNPLAGFHHDHLFVPSERAEEALEALSSARRAASG